MGALLTVQEQNRLLGIARDAISLYLNRGTVYEPSCGEGSLQESRGVFVTLIRNGQLRGCIGTFHSQRPLCREVAAMAIAAATGDPRFYPMTPKELEDVSIEISVLSPLRKIDDSLEIEVGKHGIYLEMGGHSGVLLPQVAVENRWDRRAFLQNTCCKAGLDKNAWQSPDCTLYVFSAQIFGDSGKGL